MARLKIGDRVQIPEDSHTYEIRAIDIDQGFAYLESLKKHRSSFWVSLALCSRVEVCSQ